MTVYSCIHSRLFRSGSNLLVESLWSLTSDRFQNMCPAFQNRDEETSRYGIVKGIFITDQTQSSLVIRRLTWTHCPDAQSRYCVSSLSCLTFSVMQRYNQKFHSWSTCLERARILHWNHHVRVFSFRFYPCPRITDWTVINLMTKNNHNIHWKCVDRKSFSKITDSCCANMILKLLRSMRDQPSQKRTYRWCCVHDH